MTAPVPPLFAFAETDHLTRIHLRLALEDIGFAVNEADDELAIGGAAAADPPDDQ